MGKRSSVPKDTTDSLMTAKDRVRPWKDKEQAQALHGIIVWQTLKGCQTLYYLHKKPFVGKKS